MLRSVFFSPRCLPGIVLVLLTGWTLPVCALDPTKALSQYGHVHWSTEDGLPQNLIYDIAQDEYGYLWLATEEGVVRFDGTNFTVFDTGNSDLASDFVFALHPLPQGTGVWLGTPEGITRFHGETATRLALPGTPALATRALAATSGGDLWVGGDGGLALLKGDRRQPSAVPEMADREVWSLLEDRRGSLWVGTLQGLYRFFDPGAGGALHRVEGLTGDHVMALLEDRDGDLWVGTNRGLSRLRGGSPGQKGRQTFLKDKTVQALHQDPFGTLWIGTSAGLYRLLNDRIRLPTDVPEWTRDDIRSLFEDREGNLWVGSATSGLHQLQSVPFTTYGAAQGLPHEIILPLFEDRDGSVWAGTFDGVARFSRAEGRWQKVPETAAIPGNRVQLIFRERRGHLWISTNGGLSRLRGDEITPFRTEDGLAHNVVLSMLEDRSGALWVGTLGGLSRRRGNTWTSYRQEDGLPGNLIRTLFEDSQGRLWIGTNGGLARREGTTFVSLTPEDGLSNPDVMALHEEPEGVLWIATLGGLNRLEAGRITRYTKQDGLFHNALYSILSGGDGTLWMSCNKGVFQVQRAELEAFARGEVERIHSISYGEADGMRSAECNGSFQAGLHGSDGRLWFPTTRGVAVVDPVDLRSAPPSPPVRLESVVINGTSLSLLSPPSLQSAVVQPVGQGEVEVAYTAPSFLAPGDLRFRYRFSGGSYDSGWKESDERRASFTNLPPGRHRFQVQAAYPGSPWSDSADLGITLQPRFHQTGWFVLLCTLSLAAVVWIGYRWRVAQLRRHNRLLEERVRERTAALEHQRNELAQTNRDLQAVSRSKDELMGLAAHDLRSPLVNLRGFAGEIRRSLLEAETLLRSAPEPLPPEARRKALSLLRSEIPEAVEFLDSSADRMDRLVDAILQLSRLERRRLKLEAVDLKALTQEILDTLSYQIEQESAEILLEDLPSFVADRTLVEMVLENLLSNALKYLQPGRPGRIEIGCRTTRDETVIWVRDNGRGIPEERRSKVFQIFGRAHGNHIPGEGMGLAYAQALVRRHRGRIDFDSTLGEGSTFWFALPNLEPAEVAGG